MNTGYHRPGWQSKIDASIDEDEAIALKKLTPKRALFARCVASGMTQADAYREAYDPKDSTTNASIHTLASRLMAEVEIRSRVDSLIVQRDKAVSASAVSDRDRVLRRLRQWMDDAEPTDGIKLRAAELLGKSAGLFVAEMNLNTNTQRDPTEVAAAIQSRLAGLLVDQPEGDEEVH